MKMRELFELYEAEHFPALSEASRRDYRGMLRFLADHFGDLTPQEIKPRMVRDFLQVKTGRVHRNRLVMILSMVIDEAIANWCIDDDLRNPCRGIRRWPTKPRDRYVTDDEFAAFRATCPAQIQIAMDLAYLTAQRQSDVVGLRWSQVEITEPEFVKLPTGEIVEYRGWLHIRQGKTGKCLDIRISMRIFGVLTRARILLDERPHQQTHVLQTFRGKPYTPWGFRAKWQLFMRKWVRRGQPNFHFHDIRAKALSDMPDLHRAYDLSGHNDIKMTRRVYKRNAQRVDPVR